MSQDYQVTVEIIEQALNQACLKGGYCTKLTGEALLKKYQNNVNAEKFATAVLYAEGLHPEYSDGRYLIERTFLECVERAKQK